MSSPGVAELLRAAAADEPERDAYLHEDRSATYGWLDQVVDGFAATLLDRGVRPGERVCLLLPSSIKFAVCYLGAARARAVTAAVDLALDAPEQAALVAAAAPTVTVVGDDVVTPPECGDTIPVTALKQAFGAAPTSTFPTAEADDPVCLTWSNAADGAPIPEAHTNASLAADLERADAPARHARVELRHPFADPSYMTRIATYLARRVTLVIAPEPVTGGRR